MVQQLDILTKQTQKKYDNNIRHTLTKVLVFLLKESIECEVAKRTICSPVGIKIASMPNSCIIMFKTCN